MKEVMNDNNLSLKSLNNLFNQMNAKANLDIRLEQMTFQRMIEQVGLECLQKGEVISEKILLAKAQEKFNNWKLTN